MIKNYVIITFRNLMRNKVFSIINIVGLAFGLTCALLIASFVFDELNYDKRSANHRNIYRVGQTIQQNGGIDDYPVVDVAVGAGMKNAYPEIVAMSRITGGFKELVHYKDVQFKEDRMVWADSNFLEMMGVPLVEGNDKTALTEPNSLVISKSFSKKYFGDKSPLGETLSVGKNFRFTITGVIDELPDNSHFHFDAFASSVTVPYFRNGQTWSNLGFYTYLQLNEHANPKDLEAKFPALIEKHVLPEIQRDMGSSLAEARQVLDTWKFYLMPLTDIHLRSATKFELEANGDISYVYIFGVLAFFILLLAGINFTNLSTANSFRRSREVGIRKALGSFQHQLMRQFLMESVILSLLAVAIALFFVAGLLPFFNDLTAKHISILFFLNKNTMALLIAAAVVMGLLAGSYPAFFLSSFKTIQVLKSNSPSAGSRPGGLRNALVVFQFAISTSLIIATIIVYQQLHYLQNLKLGYNKDQILVIDGAGALGDGERVFRQKLLDDHRVVNATVSSDAPVGNAMTYNGTEVHAKGTAGGDVHSTIFYTDYDYLNTLGMKVVIGRNFAKEFPSDSAAVVINETAMRDLGWAPENVVGQVIIRSGRREYSVVGVVADFHYTSARQKIAPLMLLLRPAKFAGPLIAKVKTEDIKGFLADLSLKWKSFNANSEMDYYFLDDRFATMYKAEETTQKIFIVFVTIAIVIACLGLFGLSTFSAEQRIKEVGIRKVLGSSVRQVLVLLSRDFVYLVLIAFVIAAPVSWWAMDTWLQNFSYHIEIQVWVFLLAGMIAVAIAVVTTSYQALRTALINPVESLRSE